jgi:hypothetical protein
VNSTHRRLSPGHGAAVFCHSFPRSHSFIRWPATMTLSANTVGTSSSRSLFFSIHFLVSGNTLLIRNFFVYATKHRPRQRSSHSISLSPLTGPSPGLRRSSRLNLNELHVYDTFQELYNCRTMISSISRDAVVSNLSISVRERCYLYFLENSRSRF